MHPVQRPERLRLSPKQDSCLTEPAAVVSAMASAVERVRRMAVNVFKGDASLFADSVGTPELSADR